MRVSKLLLVGLYLLNSGMGFAQADSPILSCLSPLHKLANPKFDTSVELEMQSDAPVLKLFTSENGYISGILKHGEVPAKIQELFPDKTPEEILKTPWRDIAPYQQVEILKAGAASKGTSFFQDRKIPNVKYEEGLFAQVSKPTEFLGKLYPEGLQSIWPKEFLKGPIEYMGPLNTPQAVELHFRINKPSGETSREARNFQELMGIRPTHQHVYIVSPIPQKKLERNPKLIATQNADFYRRLNLAAEIIAVMEDGSKIREKTFGKGKEQIYFFGSLKPENLVKMAKYLETKGKGEAVEPLKDELKIAWVGFRGSDKFDQPNLMGLEFRSVGPKSDLVLYERLLNTIQKSWLQQRTGIPLEKINNWLEGEYSGNFEKALKENWYQKEWKEVVAHSPKELATELGWWKMKGLERRFGVEHEEVKMLFHDWSKDPLFFDSPEKQATLREAQIRAVRELKQKDANIRNIMRTFFNQSGLYESVLLSLNPG